MTTNQQRLLPTIALLVAIVLWGSSFVVMKYSFQEIEPLLIIFGRLVVASLCFLPFLKAFVKLPVTRKHIFLLLIMGLCEPCFYFLFEAAALQHTTASQASMITTMLPMLVAIVAGMFLGEHISKKTVCGFFVAAGGAIWLSLSSHKTELAPNPVWGNFLEFMAMVCATGYITLCKYLSRDLPSLFLTGVQSFCGALFFLLVVLFLGITLPEKISVSSILVIVYLGLFVSFGAYGLYNFGVSHIPVSQASAFINLIPVTTLILGYLVLGERLTIWQIPACTLVLMGVLLSQDRHAS
ncbi:MAG: EamA family transporter [Desulfobulbus propionicus]|nr:MAG: EamA family transporter [Desulfobulbus propionicus]